MNLRFVQHFSNNFFAFLRELSEINSSVIHSCWQSLIFSDMQSLKPCGKGTKVGSLILWVKPYRTLASSAMKTLSASWQEQDYKMLWTEDINSDLDYTERITVQIQRTLQGLQVLIFHAMLHNSIFHYCFWLNSWNV